MSESESPAMTCITCRVVFASGDLQREHYKTDWHRYNLKRKVAELQPVTAEVFRNKVMAYRQEAEKIEEETAQKRCQVCNKTFRSAETYDNHCRSNKHKDAVQRGQEEAQEKETESKAPDVEETVLEDEEDSEWEDQRDEIELNQCLFCSEATFSIHLNLMHMAEKHGFFIPDIQYCTDAVGMITYLGGKIAIGNLCLWCSERKSFHSLDAVQKHMRDKGHCKIPLDSENMLEYSDFYDFSLSYPDAEEGSTNPDSEVFQPVLEQKEWQLVLPSGATIGHRALKRYYNQNLKKPNVRKHAFGQKPRVFLPGVVSLHCKALGITGSSGEVMSKIAKDMRFVQKLKFRHNVKLGVKSNKLREDCNPR